MLSVQDRNFLHLLITVTDTIFEISTELQDVQSWTHARKIYDELVSLWSCVMVSPHLTSSIELEMKSAIGRYRELTSCPLKNGDDSKSGYLLDDLCSGKKSGIYL